MLFHVSITVSIPHNADPKKIKQLGAQEHERAKELQLQGKWVHLWRVAGRYANVSVFDVESSDELHEILNSLPLYPFMEIEVTALCHHPGSLEPALRGHSGKRHTEEPSKVSRNLSCSEENKKVRRKR